MQLQLFSGDPGGRLLDGVRGMGSPEQSFRTRTPTRIKESERQCWAEGLTLTPKACLSQTGNVAIHPRTQIRHALRHARYNLTQRHYIRIQQQQHCLTPSTPSPRPQGLAVFGWETKG